jgi:hypothetical protein
MKVIGISIFIFEYKSGFGSPVLESIEGEVFKKALPPTFFTRPFPTYFTTTVLPVPVLP